MKEAMGAAREATATVKKRNKEGKKKPDLL